MNASMPSYRFYHQTESRVQVVTHDRIYQIDPPSVTPTACNGKYWLVYQQNIATGELTIRHDAAAYQCGGDLIPGEPDQPASHLPSSEATVNRSWLNFGGIPEGYAGIDWDLRR